MGRAERAKRNLEDIAGSDDDAPRREGHSFAQDLVLAMLDVETGKFQFPQYFEYAVSAAALLELLREQRLSLSGTGKNTRVEVRDKSPLGDPELDDLLAMIVSGIFGNKVHRLTGATFSGEIVRRLVREGVLTESSHRRLGVFTTHRYQPASPSQLHDLVDRLRRALRGESTLDERTTVLLAVLGETLSSRPLAKGAPFKEAQARTADALAQLPEDQQPLLTRVHEVVQREAARD